ncbi:hypothetical protein CLV30_109180 [Haloactinopolyspora alba]|uniref:Uncharacterized protein n=1 Tax=Haloactinopolyspora alba TaxID=648780 RepID=A0A2P8E074_9ACTN|nr:hypothetical protein [Haloactinopolyspora alba]PSL02872.1 hypothetical protein CLV30_109180 [Haloactinopolyspora alba]
MKPSEVSDLLEMAAATDRRKVGMADVEAWHAIITEALGEDAPFDDARKAVVQHYGATHEYLMPIHVVEYVRRLRKTRRWKIPMPQAPPELVDSHGYPDPDDREKWQAYQEWKAEITRQIENGEYMPDPPPDVVRKSMAEVESADGQMAAWNRLDSWERWLDKGQSLPQVEAWPGAEPAAEIDETPRTQRDMSALDNVVKTI